MYTHICINEGLFRHAWQEDETTVVCVYTNTYMHIHVYVHTNTKCNTW